jgi:hypothetical protein
MCSTASAQDNVGRDAPSPPSTSTENDREVPAVTDEYTPRTTIIDCGDGEITVDDASEFRAVWSGVELGRFTSLGKALEALSDAGDEFSGEITYGVAVDDVLAALGSVDAEQFLPWSPDGWARCNFEWAPSHLLPTFDGPSSHCSEVYSVDRLGCWATVHECEGTYLLQWSGPEGEDQDWEFLGAIDEPGAIAEADEKLGDLLRERHLDVDEFIGLGNLTVTERFKLPKGAEAVLEIWSYLEYDGDVATELFAHYWQDDSGPVYLVTGRNRTVVGKFASVEELERAIDVEDGFGFAVERLSWADEPDEDDE